MKKAGFSCIPLFILLLFFFPPISFADDSQNGNATSETRVSNTVTNGGSTYTHIETTVNGQTNIIDSKDQGEIDVRNDNGNVTVNKSPNVTVAVSENKISTPTPTIKPLLHKTTFISDIFANLSNFFKRILHNL
jgi:hypothetical protein